jgi:methyl-accepting chemotaxis protein
MSASVDAKLKADGLIAQVHAINRSLAEGMHVVASCTDHIRESVATAVRSLQFEDIATQSLAAASIHLDRLEAMNQQATPLQDSLDQASAAADARLHSLEQFGRYVQQLREGAIRPVRKAVSQTDMRSGPVDLF